MFEHDAESLIQKLLFSATVVPLVLIVLVYARLPRSRTLSCIYFFLTFPILFLSLLITAAAFIGFSFAKILDPIINLVCQELCKVIFPVMFAERRNLIPTPQHFYVEQREGELSSNAAFSKSWKKAIKQHDLAEALKILQTTYARNGRIKFTPEMLRCLEKVDIRSRNGLTQAELTKLESSNPNLKICPLTCSVMWLPVILASNKHDHHFEFTYLLRCFQYNNLHPTTRERITDLTKIKFAHAAYRETQLIIEKVKSIWSKASQSNDYAPILEYLQSMAIDAREDAKTILRENVKYITEAKNKFINGNDNYFGTIISPNVFNRLANDPANKLLLCELSGEFMRNPVYIDFSAADGAVARHYFDLVPLLNWLIISDKMPIFGVDQRLEFHHIKYDREKKREVEDALRANLFKVILFSPRKDRVLGIESGVTSDEELDFEPEGLPSRRQRGR